ncbi:type II CRISPR RNA-guided endonuclease Cas9 [Sneathiella chinensis]|uniref:CRISPR-associated endonuclease Cas9 n=1 Tax=Sneathiella chinensis TaxID=349750 RepID=A0ABQ5U7F7_9PROT|nr:type II CRISPR RNA-guided endonuclease Cas9 [Sneathiella chinensis]GLQ07143.1 hypothetical protein GCM10007924_23640 [Sneathiella chinensis]
MNYKLALDLGSTSIGWVALELDRREPVSLLDMGVRIFDDGRDDKSKEPLAVGRRLARGMRRNRDRKKDRVLKLRDALTRHGLFPEDSLTQKALAGLDPYALRVKGLDSELAPVELGRALLHIAQRRGFKSNRKSDRGDNEAGPVKLAAAYLEQEMMTAGARTLGEYLDKQDVKRVRKTGKEYNLYPLRKMLEQEVELLLAEQQKYHGALLTDEVAEELKHIIFFQRELHKPKVGLCAFEYEAGEERAPHAFPSVQRFRIWQEVNNLDFERYNPDDPHMTQDQKNRIAENLLSGKNQTFKQIRKALDLEDSQRFNLESDARSELKGDQTAKILSNKKCFGPGWLKLSGDEQDEIVAFLLEEEDEGAVLEFLMDRYGLSAEGADNVSHARLPDGIGRLSLKAIGKILPHLRQGLTYDKACAEAGYHHSDRRTGEVPDRLPYYGEMLPHRVIPGDRTTANEGKPELFYGKVNNPTVHIVLNQVQKLVNACIERWGHPEQIAVELARDLKMPAEEHRKINARNRKENERIAKELAKLDVRNTYVNRMRFKIWEDLSSDPIERCCPFTGVVISETDIFSSRFEIEHLIPFSQCYDDGRANKVLALQSANRDKGNRTPFQAFGSSPTINGHSYDWNRIQARADRFHKSRRWRFRPDALEQLEEKGGIIARQLNDTRYLSRLASEYLQFACLSARVDTIPGQLTALMRRKWGLESEIWDGEIKNREDHRHHAIDAFVVGCTTRGMLQRIAGAARNLENNAALQEKRHKLVDDMPDPFPGFLDQVKDRFESMVISHKPDHGNAQKAIQSKNPYTIARLHEDTAYGYVGPSEAKGKSYYVVRKGVEGLTKRKDIEGIRDDVIRGRFLDAIEGFKDGSAEFSEALQAEARAREPVIHKVRVLVEKSDAVMIGITNGQEAAFKFYQGGSNAFTEIYSPTHGKDAGKWFAETIRQFDAHQPDFSRQWRRNDPTARLIMRLHNNDMVAYEQDGVRIIARVKKMTGGRVYLRSHQIAQELGDKLSWAASANELAKRQARKISVDIMGRVRDPGPKTS